MKVSIVGCESYEQEEVDCAVREAIRMIRFKFKKGAKVLLKPNLLAPFSPEKAVTTHPAILIALCKILKEEGAKVFIGDSPGYPSAKKTLRVCGMEKVAEQYGANILDFNRLTLIELENDKNAILKKVRLPDILKKADLIINLPKLKTHGFMKYTGAVKNLYGFIPGGKKGYYHLITGTEKRFASMLIDLHGFVKPQLTIMDAVVGMEGNGPTAGNPKETGLILASRDCTALDIVASEIIGYKTEEITTITEARARGLNTKTEKIGLTDAKVFYKKPFRMHQKILPKFVLNLVYKDRISINNQKCEKCLICYKQCPAKAIELKNDALKINEKECIKCYCCHELCPEQAVVIKKSKVLTYGRRLLRIIT